MSANLFQIRRTVGLHNKIIRLDRLPPSSNIVQNKTAIRFYFYFINRTWKINTPFFGKDVPVRVDSAATWKYLLQITVLPKSWHSHFKTYYRSSSILWLIWTCAKVNLKQSLQSPEQALRVTGGWGSQISWQSAHESGKIFSSTHRSALPPGKYSIVQPEGLCQRKMLMTLSGIELATFRLVAHCLNQLCHRVFPYEHLCNSEWLTGQSCLGLQTQKKFETKEREREREREKLHTVNCISILIQCLMRHALHRRTDLLQFTVSVTVHSKCSISPSPLSIHFAIRVRWSHVVACV